MRTACQLIAAIAGVATLGQQTARAASGDVQAVAASDGALELRQQGRTIARLTLITPAPQRGKPALQEATLAAGRVIVVRVPVLGKNTTEVWFGLRNGDAVTPSYSGFVGDQDSDGETRVALELSAAGVFRHETAARINRCDGIPVRLLPRRFDFTRGQFVDVPADPPPTGGTLLAARRSGTGTRAPRPRVAFPFTVASALPAKSIASAATSDADRTARALTPPDGLSDGDAMTAWIEAAGHPGSGNLLTARAAGEDVMVTGFSFLPGDVSSGKAFAAHGRARSVTAVLGEGVEHRFDITFDEPDPASGGPAGAWRRPFVVMLPKPVASACVSLFVRDVSPGRAEKTPTIAWSEISILTDVDARAGKERLLTALAGPSCRTRIGDAASLGRGVGPQLADALATAPPVGPGRGCLLEALLRVAGDGPLDGPTATALERRLPEVLRTGVAGPEARTLRDLLGLMKPPPIDTLAAVIAAASTAAPARNSAAQLLGDLGTARGRSALIGAVGAGSSELRQALRRALLASRRNQGGKPDGSADLQAAFVATPATATTRRADLIAAIGDGVKQDPAASADAAQFLRGVARGADVPFAVRARAIEALGGTRGSAAAIEVLTTMARPPTEAPLRLLAIRALVDATALETPRAHAPAAAEALSSVREALADPDPAVRAAAAQGLARLADPEATARLIAHAKQEPWPLARAAALEALSVSCGQGAGDLLARATERDVPDLRAIALTGLFDCRDSRAADVALRLLREPREQPALRTQAARLVARVRDPRVASQLAAALPDLARDASVDPAMEAIAIAAVRALADMGGEDAAAAVVALGKHPHPSLRRAALQALAVFCGTAAADSLLTAASADPDPGVAATARASQRQCRSRQPAGSVPSGVPLDDPGSASKELR